MFDGLDVIVITFNDDKDLSQLRTLLPGAHVSTQRAVDVRGVDINTLESAKIVSASGVTTLQRGRKWHHELNSRGTIGVAHANRLAMERGDRALLLLEDDYKISNAVKFVDEVRRLMQYPQEFEMAVFGAMMLDKLDRKTPVDFMPRGWFVREGTARFIRLHCVFYTPTGRRQMRRWLFETQLDMQLDALYGVWSQTRGVRVLLQTQRFSVDQKWHVSTIQNDVCVMCDIPASGSDPGRPIYYSFVSITFWVMCVVCICATLRNGKSSALR